MFVFFDAFFLMVHSAVFLGNHIFDVKFSSDLPPLRRGPCEVRRLGGFNRDRLDGR